ncbi:MAG: hypothetical protein MRJ68_08855 [Nitrospira sp.]|nr:hypothetical protein [Nitrospira sp.]
MKDTLVAFSHSHANLLWRVCNDAHEAWKLRRALVDDNLKLAEIQQSTHNYFVFQLSVALHHHALLQIAKLHDPAEMSGRLNMSLAFVVERHDWDPATLKMLSELSTRLGSLYDAIKTARHRILAHNDLATLSADLDLGAFPAGADRAYFETLFTFVQTVWVAVVGSTCADFSSFSASDAEMAIAALLRDGAAGIGAAGA